MNIIDLFNFEFKKNIKHYIHIVTIPCMICIINMIINLNNYNKGINKWNNIDILVKAIGKTSFENLISSNHKSIFILGIILCLIYSIYIWHKDFSGKNKTIYTLMTLPQSRMSVYISKFLNIICLVYMYVMAFASTLFISYYMFTPLMKGDVYNRGFIKETMYIFSEVIPYSLKNFTVVYVFGISAVISVIFTVYLLSRKLKNILNTLLLFPIIWIIYMKIELKVLDIGVSIGIDKYLIIASILIVIFCYLFSKKILKRLDF